MSDLPRGHHAGRGLILAVLVVATAALVYSAVEFDLDLAFERMLERTWLSVRQLGPF